MRKNERTKNATRNNELTTDEKTKNKGLNGVISHGDFSSFRARFSSFGVAHFVISSFRLALFRRFVISRGVFRYLVFSLGVISSWRRAVTPGEKTKKRNNEMAQTSHHTRGGQICPLMNEALRPAFYWVPGSFVSKNRVPHFSSHFFTLLSSFPLDHAFSENLTKYYDQDPDRLD